VLNKLAVLANTKKNQEAAELVGGPRVFGTEAGVGAEGFIF
jgi:hypothetical protein